MAAGQIEYTYSVFARDTFIVLFSKASLHCSSSISSMYFSLVHITTSSANIIRQGAFFLMFSVRESIMMVIRKGLKAGPWWKRVACSCSTHHYGFALMVGLHVFHQPDVLLWAHVSNTALPKGKGRVLFPNQ